MYNIKFLSKIFESKSKISKQEISDIEELIKEFKELNEYKLNNPDLFNNVNIETKIILNK